MDNDGLSFLSIGYTLNCIALFHIDNSSVSVHGAETLLSPACFSRALRERGIRRF